MTDFKKLIQQKKQKLLDELFVFLRQPSISNDKKNVLKMADIVKKNLTQLGFSTKTIRVGNAAPYFYAEMGEGKTTLLIYDHYDVMPVDPLSLWKSDPFKPEIRENKIFARGVADNKGHFMLRMQAVKMLLDTYGKLPLKIKWVVEGEEEVASPHMHEFSKKYAHLWKDADICLWESGELTETKRPLLTLGMKGIAYFVLKAEMGEKDLHSGYASIVDSPVWRLVHALATLRDEKGNVTIDGLMDMVKQPLPEEKKIMREEEWDPQALLASFGRKKFLHHGKSKEEILKHHYFGITCNICGIWAGNTVEGETKTVLPRVAHAKIDLRLIDDIDSSKVKRLIRKHLDKRGFTDVILEEVANEPPGKSDIRNKHLLKSIESIEKSYKKKVVIQPNTKGSGPAYFVASKFAIPAIQLGASHTGSTIHGPNEHVLVKNYFDGLYATINLLLDLAK